MKKRISIIVTSIFITVALSGCTVKTNSKVTETSAEKQKNEKIRTELDKVFTDLFGVDKFSGYVSISKKGVVLLEKAYGKADFDKNIENTKQTKFDIASITKQITAFSVMQLAEKKLINVDDKVDKYLPSFPHGNEITIHQLLSHTSGLPMHSEKFDIKKFRPSYANFGIDGKNEEVNLTFEPGTGFQYSNAGYILLGYIIEKVSGKPLDIYFNENIFKPLDMKNTSFKNDKGELTNLATGYMSEKKDKAELSWTFLNIGPVVGASGLCSTVEDLVKWEKALTEGKFLTKETYEKIYTANKDNYGYGWYVYKDSQGKRSYEHYGNGSGYRGYISRAVDEDIKIIILSNYGNTPMGDIVSMVKVNVK